MKPIRKTTTALLTSGNHAQRTRAEMMKDLRHLCRGLQYPELTKYIHQHLKAAEIKENPESSVRVYKILSTIESRPEYWFATWLCTHLWALTDEDIKAHDLTPSEQDTYALVLPFDQIFCGFQNLIFGDSADISLYKSFIGFIEHTELLEVVGGDTRYGERRCRRIVVRVPQALKEVLKKMPIGPRTKRAASVVPAKRTKDSLTEYVTPQEVDIPAMRNHIIENLHKYGVKKLLQYTGIALRIQSGDLILNTAKTGRAYYNAFNLPKGVRNALFAGKFEVDISAAHATIYNKLTDSKVEVSGVYEKVSKKLNIEVPNAKIIVNSLFNMMRINTARKKVLEWGGRPDELLNSPEIRHILDTRSHAIAGKLQKIESDCMRSAVKSLGYMNMWLHDSIIVKSEADCKTFADALTAYSTSTYGITFTTKTKALK